MLQLHCGSLRHIVQLPGRLASHVNLAPCRCLRLIQIHLSAWSSLGDSWQQQSATTCLISSLPFDWFESSGALQMCRADVSTYCFGLAASMGAFLLTAGTKGKRYSMPNARIMIHQPLGGASGQAVDIEIQAKEIMYHKGNLNQIMADCTGQPIERVRFCASFLCKYLNVSYAVMHVTCNRVTGTPINTVSASER